MSVVWSICIPTYNRAECLRRNLNYIFKQLTEENRGKIEVLVSNNASRDNTNDIVKDFINKGYNISYYCNEKNIGPDKNFLQCIDKAQGKYVLLLGDDDVLLNGAIDCILNILQQDDYGVVYIANNGLTFVEFVPNNSKLEKNKVDKIIFRNSNKFIMNVSYFITFMSGLVFNKKYLGDVKYYEQYIGSYLIQINFFIMAILKASKNVFVKNSLIASKINDNGGYKLTEVFCTNFNHLLNEYLSKGLKNTTIKSINNDLIKKFFPHFVCQIRTSDTKFISEDMESIFYNNYNNNWRYWVFLYPLLKLPVAALKIYMLFLRVYYKLSRFWGYMIM